MQPVHYTIVHIAILINTNLTARWRIYFRPIIIIGRMLVVIRPLNARPSIFQTSSWWLWWGYRVYMHHYWIKYCKHYNLSHFHALFDFTFLRAPEQWAHAAVEASFTCYLFIIRLNVSDKWNMRKYLRIPSNAIDVKSLISNIRYIACFQLSQEVRGLPIEIIIIFHDFKV